MTQIQDAWGVSISDSIDLRTVGPTRRSAIVNWLVVNPGLTITNDWTDEKIERAWERFSTAYSATVIRVAVSPLP